MSDEEPITVTNDTAASLMLGVMLRADETFSDVRLVVGKEKTVLTAHAVVLASTAEYYKEALSPKWAQASEAEPIGRIDTTDESAEIGGDSKRSDEDSKRSDERAKRSDRRTNRKFLRTSQVAPTQSKPTLSHPDVDVATVNLVLDYMYTGIAKIPRSLIFSVIAFADEILVPGLVENCAKVLVDGKFITSENALEFYVLCEEIQILQKYRSFALDVVLEDLFPSLESGREFLVQMDKDEIEMLLLFDHFSPLDRWMILIAWCKAHLSSEIELDIFANYPDEISDDLASELIEPLLPAVDLFKMDAEGLKYVGYYQEWLPEVLQNLLEFRRYGTTTIGCQQVEAGAANLYYESRSQGYPGSNQVSPSIGCDRGNSGSPIPR
ncbi:hypothetical protein HDU78_004943 [Chytriomyces hyalinus]|nr:hypothetical protein HDU78_004943 [Chytriomyces hyalinus]